MLSYEFDSDDIVAEDYARLNRQRRSLNRLANAGRDKKRKLDEVQEQMRQAKNVLASRGWVISHKPNKLVFNNPGEGIDFHLPG